MNYQTKLTTNKPKIVKTKRLLLPLIISILVLLNGCVRYDVGVDFHEQHNGQIVQHIRLAEQLTSLSKTEVTEWLNSIESRAKSLQGKAKKVSDEEILNRTYALMEQGAKGIVYGRNVIHHAAPAGMTRALMAVGHEGLSGPSAFSLIS